MTATKGIRDTVAEIGRSRARRRRTTAAVIPTAPCNTSSARKGARPILAANSSRVAPATIATLAASALRGANTRRSCRSHSRQAADQQRRADGKVDDVVKRVHLEHSEQQAALGCEEPDARGDEESEHADQEVCGAEDHSDQSIR